MIRIYLRHIWKITMRERKEIWIPHRFLAIVTRQMFPWTTEGEAGRSCKHFLVQIGSPGLQECATFLTKRKCYFPHLLSTQTIWTKRTV